MSELNVFQKHQLKIAKQTLKMSDAGARIMGGMSKDEAREIIKRLTGKSKQNPRHNPPSTKIYGKVHRIMAEKSQKHICDAACKRAGHRYFHDFKTKPAMYGLANGDILITSRKR